LIKKIRDDFRVYIERRFLLHSSSCFPVNKIIHQSILYQLKHQVTKLNGSADGQSNSIKYKMHSIKISISIRERGHLKFEDV